MNGTEIKEFIQKEVHDELNNFRMGSIQDKARQDICALVIALFTALALLGLGLKNSYLFLFSGFAIAMVSVVLIFYRVKFIRGALGWYR